MSEDPKGSQLWSALLGSPFGSAGMTLPGYGVSNLKFFTLVVARTIYETNGRVDACQLTESKVTGFTVTGHLAARSDANAASTGPRPWIRTQYAYAIGGAKVVSTNECLVRTIPSSQERPGSRGQGIESRDQASVNAGYGRRLNGCVVTLPTSSFRS